MKPEQMILWKELSENSVLHREITVQTLKTDLTEAMSGHKDTVTSTTGNIAKFVWLTTQEIK